MGDSNLRLINNLSLLSLAIRNEGLIKYSKVFELDIGKARGRFVFDVKYEDKKFWLNATDKTMTEDDTYKGGGLPAPTTCHEYGGQIEDGGPFVRGLEQILGSNHTVFMPFVAAQEVVSKRVIIAAAVLEDDGG